MDENAGRIFAEARETLQRTADIEVERRDHSDDPLRSWRRNMPKPEPAPVQCKLTNSETARWKSYIDGQINAAVSAAMAEHRMLADARREAVGKALGEVRAKLREEIVAAVGELRADLTIEKAHAGDRATVIDLPAVLPRDRRAG